MTLSKDAQTFIEKNIDLMERNTSKSWQKFFEILHVTFNAWSEDYADVCKCVYEVVPNILEFLTTIPEAWAQDQTQSTLVIPKNITSIGNRAFQNAVISEVYYEGTLDEYLKINWEGSNYLLKNNTKLFIDNKLVESVTFDTPSVDQSFTGYKYLKHIVFGKNVRDIESYAFEGCTNIETVEFLTDAVHLGAGNFDNCAKLKLIGKLPEFLRSSRRYSSTSLSAVRNICANSHDDTDGIYYIGTKDNPIKFMCGVADSSLTELHVKDGCTVILAKAITKNYDTIVLPPSLQIIDSDNIIDCDKLVTQSELHVEGTSQTQWKARTFAPRKPFPKYTFQINVDSLYLDMPLQEYLLGGSTVRQPAHHLYTQEGLVTSIDCNNDVSAVRYMYISGDDIKDVKITSNHEYNLSLGYMKALKSFTCDEYVVLSNRCFANATGLEEITFLGTTKEWRKVKKEPSWKAYSALTRIVCTDGVVTFK